MINRIHKDGDGDASFQLDSDSLPHAHAQTTKTYYKHQDSKIIKAQELKTKTSAQTTDIQDLSIKDINLSRDIVKHSSEDVKYMHVGQDTRSQRWKRHQTEEIKIKDLGRKRTSQKTMTKAKDQRSQSMKEHGNVKGIALERRDSFW
ncbi:hypothetical protein Tco_0137724 [Tanacetum coccineum]